MESISLTKKQIVILLIFSCFASIIAIIHGIFFDLDLQQIKRLTLGGLLLTVGIIFPSLLFLEWVFDLNNKEQVKRLEKRLKRK